MKPYKSCSCRDAETKRLLGKKCPKLSQKGHGRWYARYEAPRAPGEKRRQPRIGPFDTERACKAALAKALGQVTSAKAADEQKTTMADYMERRYAWRKSEAETGGLAATTLESERETLDLYLLPGLGHIKVVDLTDDHIRQLYASMRKLNRPGEAEDRSETLRRLQLARATRDGRRIHSRPISESRIKRVHAVLTGVLTDAVKTSKIRADNPADGVWRTKGGKRGKGRIKPLLWTAERVDQWERTGRVPAAVMVWSSQQCGAFLDFSEASEERLHPLFHLDSYWGLRRGELVALERADLSTETRRLHVRQSQADDELDDTKSEAGDRQITLDAETARVLKGWRKQQLQERMQWGELYQDSGRVFTYEDGAALKPAYVSQRFKLLIERYGKIRQRHAEGWTVDRIARQHRIPIEAVRVALTMPLPPIRFHDLRHGAATMLIAAGVPMKLVSDVLGHASMSFTADVYAAVAEELAEQAAAAISAFVPRTRRPEAVGAINVPSGGKTDA